MVCVACAPGVYVQTSSMCACTSGAWACSPPSPGEVTCPDHSANGSDYVDPACTAPEVADGGGDARTDGATDAGEGG